MRRVTLPSDWAVLWTRCWCILSLLVAVALNGVTLVRNTGVTDASAGITFSSAASTTVVSGYDWSLGHVVEQAAAHNYLCQGYVSAGALNISLAVTPGATYLLELLTLQANGTPVMNETVGGAAVVSGWSVSTAATFNSVLRARAVATGSSLSVGLAATSGTANISALVLTAAATPTVTAWPSASAIKKGQALSSSALTGGSASVPGAFSFSTPSTTPPAGSYSASVRFTPADQPLSATTQGSVLVSVSSSGTLIRVLPKRIEGGSARLLRRGNHAV